MAEDKQLYGSIRTPSGQVRNPLTDRLGVRKEDLNTIQTGTETIQWGVSPLVRGFLDAKHHKSSIIGMARENVFEFPVFMSNTIPLDYATATNTLLEQVYGSYLQMALSVDPIVNYQQIQKRQKGSQFAKFKTDTSRYLESAELSYQVDTCHAKYENTDGSFMEFELVSIEDDVASVINEAMDYEPLSEFDHYFQEAPAPSTPTVPSDEELKLTREHPDVKNRIDKLTNEALEQLEKSAKDKKSRGESLGPIDQLLLSGSDSDRKRVYDAFRQNLVSTETSGATDEEKIAALKKMKIWKGDASDIREIEKHLMSKEKHASDMAKDARDEELHELKKKELEWKTKTNAPEFIDETKIQKMNTMKPLMMKVQMGIMDKNGTVSRPIDYIVGVKTHCRLIDNQMLPEVAEYPLKEMNKITRKAKWRSGEMKFFKDIVFHIKEKKQTAIDAKDPRRKWFRRLYELAHMKGDAGVSQNVTGSGTAVHGLIPNATIVVSKADIDNIEAKTKIDLLNADIALRFCEELFLMNFIVIDTDEESIKILTPDINNDFEVQSLAAVNKQIAQLDTAGATTRDVFKMLK